MLRKTNSSFNRDSDQPEQSRLSFILLLIHRCIAELAIIVLLVFHVVRLVVAEWSLIPKRSLLL